MRVFTGVGRVARIDYRVKDQVRICIITVPFKHREDTMWVEVVAFDETADAWSQEFAKGDTIFFSGTPEIRTYMKADQTPAAVLRVRTARYGVKKVFGPADEKHAFDGIS